MERDPRTLAMPSVRPDTIDRDYRASFLPRLLPPLLDTSHFALAIIISLLLAPPTKGRKSWGGAVNRWKRKNRSIFRERALDYYPLTVVEEWVSIRLSRVRRRSSRLKTIDGRVRIVLIERSRQSGGDTCGFVGHAQGTRSPIDIHLVLSPSTTPCCCCYSYGIRTTPNPRWTTLAMIEEEGRGATS